MIGLLRFCLLLVLVAAPVSGSVAGALDDLYTAKAIVTGTGEKNRLLGFRDCLDRVLVRVSGDQRLLALPAVAKLRYTGGDLIASFSYRDRLEGIPIHDEQGSHDRPHDLACRFDRTRLDATLVSLGSRPWLGDRPLVSVLLSVEQAGRRFILAADGEESPYMDESLAGAAEPLAIRFVLPDKNSLQAAGLDPDTLPKVQPSSLQKLAERLGGNVPMLGHLVWSDTELGWIADWHVESSGAGYSWQVRGVSFDEAFRNAMRGAAQILSGNGQP